MGDRPNQTDFWGLFYRYQSYTRHENGVGEANLALRRETMVIPYTKLNKNVVKDKRNRRFRVFVIGVTVYTIFLHDTGLWHSVIEALIDPLH